jgi:metallo-beta-lactamase family protein
MLDVRLGQGDRPKRIIFSGDIGQPDKPLIHDPSVFDQADYVVMESTYGDRDHEDGGDIQQQLEQAILRTVSAKGNVVIPTFAVERAQELIYHLSGLVHEKRIPDIAIFLDSPMAVDVTEIFRRHRDRFDAETWNLIAKGSRPLQFPGLTLSRTREQSMAINNLKQPAVIMSTSGMCTAGRIKHHLKRNVGRPESTVLFVGYQAEGTLGRQILDGKREVRIHGQQWPIKARIDQIFGFSGHADRGGLLEWLSHFKQPPRRLFLTHGDKPAANALARQIRGQFGWSVLIPDYESTSDL